LSKPWLEEFWRILGIVALAILLGAVLGHFSFWLLLGTAAYLAWHISNIIQLANWLRTGLQGEPRYSRGIWDQIFLQLYRLNQKQQKRYARLVDQLGRFQEAAEALPDAIVVLDHDATIQGFNEAAIRLLGLNRKKDSGQRLLNLLRHPALAEYFSQGDYSKRVQINSPVNEGLLLAIHVVPYGAEQRLLMARDITHLQRLEQMRRDFVANVSHEMRTPLTVIGGYLETFKDMGDECAQQWGQSLEQMLQQTTRMGNLVNDLLLLARLESSEVKASDQPVNVSGLIDTIKEEALLLSADKHHQISVECDKNLLLKGEQQELHSAFSNLVSNAVRYTPANGTIRIRWYANDTGAHFEVSDTGIGIAPKHIPRLTERFYRVDVARSRHSGGTGLGLAIVKHVLERHQGILSINSEPNVGSTFCCDFPMQRVTVRSAA
jgi:two-component system phosphate regulon sensor histidine kinase PhoR